MSAIKLQQIDEKILHEHSCLESSDRCYILGEYASGQGFQYSDMNQVINNLKKPIDRKHLKEWRFKERAILDIAYWLVSLKYWEKLKKYTWIPMPPSKVKSDAAYDDRLVRILERAKQLEAGLDIREILIRKSNRDPAHNPGSKRPNVHEHIANLEVDESLLLPSPQAIVIFDDIITSGASFKSAQTVLKKHYPDIPIVGIFVARNIKVIPDL